MIAFFIHHFFRRGFGLQAKEFIPKGSYVMEYTGEVVRAASAGLRDQTYLFDLWRPHEWRNAEVTYLPFLPFH